jgi:type 1 fimbria pilin
MNTVLKSVAVALLAASSATAVAASSVDLTVKGLITPSACTPALSNGGTVDYGKISAKDLNIDKVTPLAEQSLQLTVTCDAATLMALDADDNRAGSNHGNDMMEFGLGLINDTEKLGAMTVRLISPIADGVAVKAIGSEDGGVTWFTERYLMPENLISVANTSADAPIPVQVLTSEMYVSPKIAPANGLTLTNEAAIDGSVTITVRYL